MSRLTIAFAGDSGDGVQLLGNTFADYVSHLSLHYNTLPDFPAEIRAPAGKIYGVSGFQIQYGDEQIFTAGNYLDILVAFNAAGFLRYRSRLKPNGLLIYDPSGFDAKNCKLANFEMSELEGLSVNKREIAFSTLTLNALKDSTVNEKDKDKNKNIFALGLLIFGLGKNLEAALDVLNARLKVGSDQKNLLTHILKSGFYFGETIDFTIPSVSNITAHQSLSDDFKSISGNKAISLALLAAPKVFSKSLFFGGYPITPASDILGELSKNHLQEITVQQAEDEIAAASMALGAAYGGSIGVTASSGPGIDLKQEAIGLALMAEVPLLIIDIQRAGPSTGMPTKIEQSDFDLAMYGRHGDSPVPILAIGSPSRAYELTLLAIDLMLRFQTPVFLLSDAAVANSSERWQTPVLTEKQISSEYIQPIPGTPDSIYRKGGLERDYLTGMISYDGENHQMRTNFRQEKMLAVANYLPLPTIQKHCVSDILIVTWGSTYGAVVEALKLVVSARNTAPNHLHLECLFPLNASTISSINNYSKIIIPELNTGQVAHYLKTLISIPIIQINKVQGEPFIPEELCDKILLQI